MTESLAVKWQALFTMLVTSRALGLYSDLGVAQVNSCLGAVRLIQPFNWTNWYEPLPTLDEAKDLSLAQCVKQVTRLVRADRTQEGVLARSIEVGLLEALCRTAHEKSESGLIPIFQDLDNIV